MGHALELAARGRGLTSPNPMVGAVVVRGDEVVGEGYHERAGAGHAEALALARAGTRAAGATLYVTLEPCNHHGRTPPCTAAVIASGVSRVVFAIADPNPRVAGGGAAALRAAGIAVEGGCAGAEARALNRVFLTAATRSRPHVVLKCAMSLDGRIAAADGRSQWITGEAARAAGHRLRSESDAIAVGIGTALADDPALTVRLEAPWPREPYRVVLDSRARLAPGARLITAGDPRRALVAVTEAAPVERVRALEAAGAVVLVCKSGEGRVDLHDLSSRLFALGVHALLLEGGAELAGGFLDARLVDRVAMFVAPLLLGGHGATGAVGGAGRPLAQGARLAQLEVRPVGPDLLVEADVLPEPPDAPA
jgi:diaminohydroxyphosphoribosylaminopyrimidine deaminase/5-amino-6-(5-phosphoribosylamino)uracil reductase